MPDAPADNRGCEEALKHAEGERRLLAGVVESLPEAVIVTDGDGNVVDMNAEARRLGGFQAPEQGMRHVTGFPEFELRTLEGEPIPREAMSLESVLHGRESTAGVLQVRDSVTRKTSILAYSNAPIPADGDVIGAVLSVRDVTAEKRVEREMEEALHGARLLVDSGRRLASTIDLHEVLECTTGLVREALGRSRAAIADINEAGDEVVILSSTDQRTFPNGLRLRLKERSADILKALSSGKPVVVDYESPSLPSRLRRAAADADARLALFLPTRTGGTVTGLVGVDEPGARRPFAQGEIELAEGIVLHATAAIENARRFEAERRGRILAEAIDDINRLIHSSRDYDSIMQSALEEATKTLGARSGAVFVGLDDESEARYVYGFPKLLLGRRFPASAFPFSRLMEETKEPVAVGPDRMDSLMNPALARLFKVRSILAIPLVSRGELMGGIGIVFDRPHEFVGEELDFARKLGASASLALENARLYEAEHRVAETLQEALLALPKEVPGIAFAHVYHSAAEAARVGGDFYDLFEIENDRVGMTIGDVAGKGLNAAVLTSLVKNTIRAHAVEKAHDPSRILGLTNEVVYKATPREAFVTVFFGVLDCSDGRLVYSNAGHTAAGIVRIDGRTSKLPANSPLVGAFSGGVFAEAVTHLDRDELVFLYTDGLIEARRDGELFGEERLFEILARTHDGDPAAVVRTVADEVAAYTRGRLSDDLAILALKRMQAKAETPAPSEVEL